VIIGLVIVIAVLVIAGMLLINPGRDADLGQRQAASSINPSESIPVQQLGDRIQLDDEEYLTVTQVSSWTGTENVKPPDNYSFVAVEVQVEGIRQSGASVDPNWFTLRDSQQQRHDEVATGKEPMLQTTDALAPGTDARGWLTFQIPENEGQGLTLVYDPPFASRPVAVALD
jgi:hypothetical protein